MKKVLIERLDSFIAAPFTIQRISELLADPRKQYSRIDKFMRAVEKNILVVSTVTPGRHRPEESENGDSLDSALNGEFSSDVNVDIDMDNEGSFAMTKDFTVSTHRKEANHDIVSTNHETITIKKTASAEEEASTSAIAVDPSTGDAPKGTETEISIETNSTVTITVCEPEVKDEKIESKEEPEVKEEEPSEEAKVEPESIKEENIPDIIEPKVEDALLNEPIRPADDEILVDASDIIGATTPLAALENIVAIRTDPSSIEAVEPPRIESEASSEESQDEPSPEEHKETEVNDCEDESGIEAKRLKIEEVEEKQEEVPAKDETQKEEKATEQTSNTESLIEDYVDEPKEEPEQPEISPVVEEVPQVTETPITDATPIVQEPIPTETIEEIIPEEPIEVATPAETMETVPIAENTMALDEEEPQSAPAMEITPAASKMDTDENETETALMDVEDDEPMDQ